MGYVEDLSDVRTKLADCFSILLVEGERNRRKRKHKHGKRDPADNDPLSTQRYVNIVHGRMPEAPKSCHKSPEPPASPAHETQNNEDGQHDKRHGTLTCTPQGIRHMSAVELADGNEIQ